MANLRSGVAWAAVLGDEMVQSSCLALKLGKSKANAKGIGYFASVLGEFNLKSLAVANAWLESDNNV